MAGPDSSTPSWPEQYRRLLAASGLDQSTELTGALQPQDTNRTALFSLAQGLENPDLFREQVQADYPQATTAQAVTARLSVLQQDLALSVIAPLTLRLFLNGRASLPDPNRIFLGHVPPGSDNLSRWFFATTAEPVAVAEFVDGVAKLANHWYTVFRRALGVSPGAYWSSIGLGLGAPFSVIWDRGEPMATCQLAQAWLKQFECDANRFIDWIPAEFNGQFGGQSCAVPQRKGCCLKYLLPNGDYCGTCGIYRKERMAAVTVHQIQPPQQEG
ncbi:(2Fe-2S)-binding protein [Marinobacter sp.]|uniref:(2Fe-2S)-binding protein n=1 Tax=Marinobacter sp. TaxID=50741 RepID=UPI0034A5B755